MCGSYNISNGRKEGLKSALRGMDRCDLDLGVFQEIKFTNRVNTQDFAVYRFLTYDVCDIR